VCPRNADGDTEIQSRTGKLIKKTTFLNGLLLKIGETPFRPTGKMLEITRQICAIAYARR
jgi:hypothetical protein